MSTTTLFPRDTAPTEQYVTIYTAVVLDNEALVLVEDFAHASARRDAVVELLLVNHDEVEPERIERILAPFGGANADVALGHITALYEPYGIKVFLTEKTRPRELAALYTIFTDYGDGDTYIEHYASQEARRDALLERVRQFYTDVDGNPLPDDVTEAALTQILETLFLISTRGRVYLSQATRHASRDVFTS